MNPSPNLKCLPGAAFALLGLLLPASLLLGNGSGVVSGVNGIPLKVTTAFPSCGFCHGTGNPGDRGTVTVAFGGLASVRKSVDTKFTMSISSIVAGAKGGFALTSDKGVFKPLGNTRNPSSGVPAPALTHTNNSTRTWSFLFNHSLPGLVQWHAVGNTVDGNGRNTGDSWGWFGPNPSKPGVPFRVFVNENQVFPYGYPCKGTDGFKPLIGAPRNATRGQTFPVEIHNVPPGTAALGILGISDKVWGTLPLPLSLTPLGMKGCALHASLDLILPTGTAGTGSGNGKGVFNWSIPNLASLRGASLYFTALVLDAKANSFGMTASMGLKAVIQ